MLVNPISFRLSISVFWNSTWSLYKNYNYKYLFYSDLVFFEFFMFFFKKTINLKFLDFYPSHIRLYRLNNKIIINLYYHMAKEEYYFDEIDLIYKNKKRKKLKKKISIIKKRKIFKKKKILKLIRKNILKLIFNSFYWDKNILKIKKKLKLLLKLLLKKVKNNYWKIKIKRYYIYFIKKYIYFFIKYIYKYNNINNNILKNLKKKNQLKNIKKISKRISKNLKIKKKKNKKKKLNKYNNNKKLKKKNKKKKIFLKKKIFKFKNNKKKNNITKYNSKLDFILKKIKSNFLKINSYKKFNKINNNILFIKKKKLKKKNLKKKKKEKIIIKKYKIKTNNDFNFLYKINFLKFIFNQKLWIFNFYFYYLSKYLKKINKILLFKYLKKLELNIYKINTNSITSNIISKYITSSFRNNYSIYETLRPVLIDLKDRIRKKKVAGFKITVSGRFKRAERATYWWRKDGQLLTGTQLSSIDYSTSLHKTKYGVCTINVWLTLGVRGLNFLTQDYPTFYPFFFSIKKKKINYFILKKNNLFFFNLLKKKHIESYNLKFNYIKSLISYLIYKYLYINILFKNLLLNNYKKKINKNIRKIFLPQYCKYKIYLEDFLRKNYIKIIPFIQLKHLKRINLRNSYKINFLNKSKLINIKIFKYKVFLY